MGRPFIPIEPYIEKLEQAILIGATYDLAAMYAGISKRTFARWRAAAETAREGTPLAKLRDRLREAEGKAAVGWLAHIERAAREGNVYASCWRLERRYPEMYGRPGVQKVALTDPSGEQAWEPTVGLAVLLQAHRSTLPPATNGHALPAPAEGDV